MHSVQVAYAAIVNRKPQFCVITAVWFVTHISVSIARRKRFASILDALPVKKFAEAVPLQTLHTQLHAINVRKP